MLTDKTETIDKVELIKNFIQDLQENTAKLEKLQLSITRGKVNDAEIVEIFSQVDTNLFKTHSTMRRYVNNARMKSPKNSQS